MLGQEQITQNGSRRRQSQLRKFTRMCLMTDAEGDSSAPPPLSPSGECKEIGSEISVGCPCGAYSDGRLSSRFIKSAGAFQTANIH